MLLPLAILLGDDERMALCGVGGDLFVGAEPQPLREDQPRDGLGVEVRPRRHVRVVAQDPRLVAPLQGVGLPDPWPSLPPWSEAAVVDLEAGRVLEAADQDVPDQDTGILRAAHLLTLFSSSKCYFTYILYVVY